MFYIRIFFFRFSLIVSYRIILFSTYRHVPGVNSGGNAPRVFRSRSFPKCWSSIWSVSTTSRCSDPNSPPTSTSRSMTLTLPSMLLTKVILWFPKRYPCNITLNSTENGRKVCLHATCPLLPTISVCNGWGSFIQSVSVNTAMTLVILLWLKTMELLQIGVCNTFWSDPVDFNENSVTSISIVI